MGTTGPRWDRRCRVGGAFARGRTTAATTSRCAGARMTSRCTTMRGGDWSETGTPTPWFTRCGGGAGRHRPRRNEASRGATDKEVERPGSPRPSRMWGGGEGVGLSSWHALLPDQVQRPALRRASRCRPLVLRPHRPRTSTRRRPRPVRVRFRPLRLDVQWRRVMAGRRECGRARTSVDAPTRRCCNARRGVDDSIWRLRGICVLFSESPRAAAARESGPRSGCWCASGGRGSSPESRI